MRGTCIWVRDMSDSVYIGRTSHGCSEILHVYHAAARPVLVLQQLLCLAAMVVPGEPDNNLEVQVPFQCTSRGTHGAAAFLHLAVLLYMSIFGVSSGHLYDCIYAAIFIPCAASL
jgi:hypothetical protein